MKIIPYALLGFSSLVAFVVTWALNQLWKHTIGYMFDKFAGVGIPTGFFGSIHPLAFLESVNNSVHDYLSKLAGASEHAMITFLGAALRSFLALGNEIGALAEAVEKKIAGLVSATIPHLVRGLLGAVWGQLRRIPALVKRVDHLIGYVTRQVAGAIKRAAKWELRQLLKFGKSLTHTFGGIWKNVKNLWRLVLHLEKQLTGRNLHRLVHKVLKELKLGWLFGSSVIRFGEGVLGWSYHLVTAFVRYFKRVEEPVTLVGLTHTSHDVLSQMEKALRWYISEYHADRIAPGSTIGKIEV